MEDLLDSNDIVPIERESETNIEASDILLQDKEDYINYNLIDDELDGACACEDASVENCYMPDFGCDYSFEDMRIKTARDIFDLETSIEEGYSKKD